jgi:hypothetical protein
MKIYSDSRYLSLIIGKKMNKILALSYCCDEALNSMSIQEIQLEFDGLKSVRIFCGTDGSSICWDNADIKPISMGEYGEVVISSLSKHHEEWENLVNKKLEKVYLVTSEIENCIFAIKFVFGYNFELVIANIGDDLKLQKKLTLEILEEEKSLFLDIQETSYGR